MFTLNLYTVAERRPEHGENIILFGTNDSFGDSYMTLPFLKVEYQWVQLDENGKDTGTEIVYFPGDLQSPDLRLMILADRRELTPGDVYATIKDIEEIYDKIDEIQEKNQKASV